MTSKKQDTIVHMDSKIYNKNGSSRVKESKDYNLLWNIDIPDNNNRLANTIKSVVNGISPKNAKLLDRSDFLYSHNEGAYFDIFAQNGKILYNIAKEISSKIQNIHNKDGTPFSLSLLQMQIKSKENFIEKSGNSIDRSR